MNVSEWVAHVDKLREQDEHLAAGAWHGYLADSGDTPMKGRYLLVRWAEPTIAVSHDDERKVVGLARQIEMTLLLRNCNA